MYWQIFFRILNASELQLPKQFPESVLFVSAEPKNQNLRQVSVSPESCRDDEMRHLFFAWLFILDFLLLFTGHAVASFHGKKLQY